jgi:hypothetical protein
MSIGMDEGIKRWIARRKSSLVLEILPGRTTTGEARPAAARFCDCIGGLTCAGYSELFHTRAP